MYIRHEIPWQRMVGSLLMNLGTPSFDILQDNQRKIPYTPIKSFHDRHKRQERWSILPSASLK